MRSSKIIPSDFNGLFCLHKDNWLFTLKRRHLNVTVLYRINVGDDLRQANDEAQVVALENGVKDEDHEDEHRWVARDHILVRLKHHKREVNLIADAEQLKTNPRNEAFEALPGYAANENDGEDEPSGADHRVISSMTRFCGIYYRFIEDQLSRFTSFFCSPFCSWRFFGSWAAHTTKPKLTATFTKFCTSEMNAMILPPM